MGSVLVAVAGTVRAVVEAVLGNVPQDGLARQLEEVRRRRQQCAHDAAQLARTARDGGGGPDTVTDAEWLGYAALLVQVDRIVADLSTPLPT